MLNQLKKLAVELEVEHGKADWNEKVAADTVLGGSYCAFALTPL